MITREFAPIYQNVFVHSESFGEAHYVMAECRREGRRQHRRLIADKRGSLAKVVGNVLFYADEYAGRRDHTYVYARHRVNVEEFTDHLARWYTTYLVEGRERRTVSGFINIGGKIEAIEIDFPFSGLLNKDIRFIRLNFPFGPVTVEFGKPNPASGNQLRAASEHFLPRALESPLIGSDMTLSQWASSLIAGVHWASGELPPKLLEGLIGQLSCESVEA